MRVVRVVALVAVAVASLPVTTVAASPAATSRTPTPIAGTLPGTESGPAAALHRLAPWVPVPVGTGETSGQASSTGGWTTQPAASKWARQDSWRRLSCPSSTWCMTVGDFLGRRNQQRTVSATWSGGSRWAMHRMPNPHQDSRVVGLSCVTAQFCVAVGGTSTESAGGLPLAEQWNGRTWSVMRVPAPTTANDTDLFGVSCRSTTWCMAVGLTQDFNSGTTVPVTERWDGSSWRLTTLLNVDSDGAALDAVDCPTTTTCLAVGHHWSNSTALAGKWHDGRWSFTDPPTRSTYSELTSVTCVRSECWAVGDADEGTRGLIDRWDGREWTFASFSSGSPEELLGVTCRSDTNCVAVGWRGRAFYPIALRWNGSTWTQQRPPIRSGFHGVLAGASCPGSHVCLAVGGEESSVTRSLTLVERWSHDAWSRQKSSSPIGAMRTQLASISCPTSHFCASVGAWGVNDDQHAFAEVRHDSSWTPTTTPNPANAASGPQLTGVSCAGTSSCTAVGSWEDTQNVIRNIALHWNGSHWRRDTTEDGQGLMSAVSCPTGGMCLGVGASFGSSPAPFAEVRDGSSWTTAQAVPIADGTFTSVDCLSATACFAAGSAADPNDRQVPFVAEWTGGTQWLLIGAPVVPTGATAAGFSAIHCGGTSSCRAVGSWVDGNSVAHPLAEVWNGSRWKAQPVAQPAGGAGTLLLGVSCSRSRCVAVGAEATGPQRGQPVVELLTNGAWSLQLTDVPADNASSALLGVSCRSTCYAAGAENTKARGQITLVEAG